MWIYRDFNPLLVASGALPIKILKGPRQVGKTSLLRRLGTHHVVFMDDATTRIRAEADPRFFLDQLPPKLVIDEAPLAPSLFLELKRRVDEARFAATLVTGAQVSQAPPDIDIWLTGSNQTLMQRSVGESLAGRASYFDLNTLSLHELALHQPGEAWSLQSYLLRGGWPELYASEQLDSIHYLNNLIATFIERDIVSAAGIERRAAFLKVLHLAAGRVGQLFNASDLAVSAGVDSTTVQSWLSVLELNGIVQSLPAYHTNLNKRLTKAPKYYFCDVALAVRLQGWTSAEPLLNSPTLGHLFENIVVSEISRFFVNRGERPSLHFVRSKEKVEVDLLVELGNQKLLAVEVKITPTDYTLAQHKLLDGLDRDIVERWVVSATPSVDFRQVRVLSVAQVWDALRAILG